MEVNDGYTEQKTVSHFKYEIAMFTGQYTSVNAKKLVIADLRGRTGRVDDVVPDYQCSMDALVVPVVIAIKKLRDVVTTNEDEETRLKACDRIHDMQRAAGKMSSYRLFAELMKAIWFLKSVNQTN